MADRKKRIRILSATSPLLVGDITFVVEPEGLVWRFVVGPHGDQVYSGESARDLRPVADPFPKMEDYLPSGWPYDAFVTAWSFWACGYEKGHGDGGHEQRRYG